MAQEGTLKSGPLQSRDPASDAEWPRSGLEHGRLNRCGVAFAIGLSTTLTSLDGNAPESRMLLVQLMLFGNTHAGISKLLTIWRGSHGWFQTQLERMGIKFKHPEHVEQ